MNAVGLLGEHRGHPFEGGGTTTGTTTCGGGYFFVSVSGSSARIAVGGSSGGSLGPLNQVLHPDSPPLLLFIPSTVSVASMTSASGVLHLLPASLV